MAAVDPEIIGAADAVETDHPALIARLGDLYFRTVETCGIFRCNVGGIDGEQIPDIRVMQASVSLELPAGRNFQPIPARIIIPGLFKAGRRAGGCTQVPELPFTVETELLTVAAGSVEIRVGIPTVQVQKLFVLPSKLHSFH